VKLITGNSLDARRLNTVIQLALWPGLALFCIFFAALMGSKSSGEVSTALGSFIGGLVGGALAAYAAFVAVKTTLEAQAIADANRRAHEIAAIRLALHTEVGMIATVCIREFEDWRALRSGAEKNPSTARLPPLSIYNSVCGNVGRLTRAEIVPLIKFAGTLHDIEIVAAKMAVQSTTQSANDQKTIALLLSSACGYAAEFCEVVPGIPDAHLDQPFIRRLKEAYQVMESARDRTPP